MDGEEALLGTAIALYVIGSAFALFHFPMLLVLPAAFLMAPPSVLLIQLVLALACLVLYLGYQIVAGTAVLLVRGLKGCWDRIIRRRGWMPRTELIRKTEKQFYAQRIENGRRSTRIFRPLLGLECRTPNAEIKAALEALGKEAGRWQSHQDDYAENVRARIWHALEVASLQAAEMRDDRALLESGDAQAAYLGLIERLRQMIASARSERVERKLVGMQEALSTLDEQLANLKDYEMEPAA
jgi:hypothetical protein